MSQAEAVGPIEHRERPVRMGRGGAFLEADRHTARVRFLKRAIMIVSAAAIVSLVGVTFFDPFGKLPQGLSVGQTTLDGTRITMELPKMSGFRRDGRAYEVRAASGVQDIKTPKIIELKEIEAKVAIGEKDSVAASAPIGVFDSGKDFLQLRSGDQSRSVRIASSSGYELTLRTADVDFHAGTVVSMEPVVVKLPNGNLSADSFNMSDSGHAVTFEGNVVSEIWQEAADLKSRPESSGVGK